MGEGCEGVRMTGRCCKREIRRCREGRDSEEICNREDRRSKKWRRELHCNMAEECGAAEWREAIMACEASSPPYSSQAIAGWV